LNLVNGKFVDGRGVIASAIFIRNGHIASVGQPAPGPAQTFNLRGRTVIPGLIDSHAHFIRTGTNHGHEARGIEAAFSIAELQEVVARRAETVPPGEFITCMGGWNRLQLMPEQRLPNKAELDAATSRHPVYLQAGGGGGGGVTNSLGEAFFEARGITVDDVTGLVASTTAATTALRAVQTPDDKLRGTRDIHAHVAGLGLTAIHDTGGLTTQPDDYQFALALYKQQGRNLAVRLRPYRHLGSETLTDLEAHMRANFNQIGDGVFRTQGVGEQIVSGLENFEAACRLVAQYGWTITQHTLNAAEHTTHVAAFRTVGAESDIRDLRWTLAHVTLITEAQLRDLIAVGAGVTVQDFTYLGTGRGAPFRMIVDSGIKVGAGTDSTNVSPLNPWLGLFYMATGRNLAGNLTNDGQQISRLEALRLYTLGSAWCSKEDQEVGSLEVGKLADLAVLSDDYLTVPEARIRKIRSVLTLQGGRVVHATVG
jgi:hypothetical protein